MKLILFGLLGAVVLISGASMNLADATEMKTVPFWWSVNPITGESEYTDYFKQSSTVLKEHNAYLQSSLDQNESSFSPLVMAEVERSGMIEVITFEEKYMPIRDTNDPKSYGPFANQDYMVLAEVAVSTWIKAPVVVTEDVTEEITPESVTDITAIITGITEVDEPVVEESIPKRTASGLGDTHWDQEEANVKGHQYMTTQELKDFKKQQAEWRAYETASELYPTLYPPYVHEYEHDEVVVEDKIVVPLYESEVIIDIAPEVTLPSVTSSAIVVPIPEPIVEPTPLPSVTSSVVVPEVINVPEVPQATSIVPQITDQLPSELRDNPLRNDTVVVPLN